MGVDEWISDGWTPDRARIALAVVSALPVAGFALWTDYFTRWTGTRSASGAGAPAPKTTIEPADVHRGLRDLRFGGLIAMAVQLLAFLAVSDLRRLAPLAGALAFLFALLAQAWIQGRAEAGFLRRLPAPERQAIAVKRTAAPWRAFLTLLGGAALQMGVVAVFCGGALVLGRVLGWPPEARATFVLAAAVLGMLGGIAANFLFADLHLKALFGARQATGAAEIDVAVAAARVFGRAGLRAPRVLVFDDSAGAPPNALTTARGPTLFFTESLHQRLRPDEIDAVLAHEAAHLKLGHLRARFLLTGGLVVAILIATLFLVIAAQLVLRDAPAAAAVGPLAGLLAFGLAMQMLGRQSRAQEFEADLHAVEGLGADAGALIRALRALEARPTVGAAEPEARVAGTHPPLTVRIALLEAYYERRLRAQAGADAAASSVAAPTDSDESERRAS